MSKLISREIVLCEYSTVQNNMENRYKQNRFATIRCVYLEITIKLVNAHRLHRQTILMFTVPLKYSIGLSFLLVHYPSAGNKPLCVNKIDRPGRWIWFCVIEQCIQPEHDSCYRTSLTRKPCTPISIESARFNSIGILSVYIKIVSTWNPIIFFLTFPLRLSIYYTNIQPCNFIPFPAIHELFPKTDYRYFQFSHYTVY